MDFAHSQQMLVKLIHKSINGNVKRNTAMPRGKDSRGKEGGKLICSHTVLKDWKKTDSKSYLLDSVKVLVS